MNYTEIRTITPELGEFTISGQLEEAKMALKSFGRLKEVSPSTFDKQLLGQSVRELRLGRLSLALN